MQPNNKINHQLSEADQAALLKERPQTSQSPTYWLEQLGKSGAFADIENPVEWQQQLRQDRQLSR